jgi:hypothetical protein
MRLACLPFFAFGSVSLLTTTDAGAQIRASEIGTMSQIIDGTKITMEYSRPRARGRDPLFGNPRVVRWDEVWTPGANYATTLEVSKDVTVNGNRLAKGKYSVWFVVKKDADWIVVFDPRVRRYHMEPPESTTTQVRFPVRPEAAAFTEVLTWSMPALSAGGGTLAMTWGKVRIPIEITVQPSYILTMSAADAAPYLGRYSYAVRVGPDSGKVSTLTVSHEDNTLRGQWEPNDPYFKKFALIRIAPNWFAPGVYDANGVIYEIYKPEMTFEFTVSGGKATALEVRTEDDKVEATGKRIQ